MQDTWTIRRYRDPNGLRKYGRTQQCSNTRIVEKFSKKPDEEKFIGMVGEWQQLLDEKNLVEISIRRGIGIAIGGLMATVIKQYHFLSLENS